MIERLKVKIKPEIISHCKNQIANHNFAKASKDNGNRKQQYIGIVAQSVIMDFFGLGYIDGSLGYDGGVDFTYKGKTYDVKAMTRTVDVKDSYTNNFVKRQENYDVDGYIFCSINTKKKELTVAGWIKKEDLNRIKRLKPKGTICKNGIGAKEFPLRFDMYEIDNKHLNFVNSIIDMKMQMISRWENK